MVSSGLLSVDTFFLLSGFLMSYLSLKEYEKKRSINFMAPFFSYLHRYIRLTPAYALLMLIYSTLFLHLGTGPKFGSLENEVFACHEQWWKNLLYINNLFQNNGPECMGVTWYLACDFQMFLLGPWIMILLWKFKKFAKFILPTLLVISCAIPGILTGINDWPPLVTSAILNPDWQSQFYYRSYTRSTPYIWGIVFGYLMHQFKMRGSPKYPRIFALVGWTITTATCLAAVFGLVSYWPFNVTCLTQQCYTTVAAVLWASFGRLAWAMGVSWIIFACVTGNGGLINSFLSWSLFAPLSRLTYAIYLIHYPMILLFYYTSDLPIHYDIYLMVSPKKLKKTYNP